MTLPTIPTVLYFISILLLVAATVFVGGRIRTTRVRGPWIAVGVILISMLLARFGVLFPDGILGGGGLSESARKLFGAGWSVWIASLVLVALWLMLRESRSQQRDEESRQQNLKALWFSEQRYRDSEQRLRLALDAARLGEWQLDLETMAIECNELCIRNFGLPPDSNLTYDTLRQMIHPDDRLRVGEAMGRALDERTVYDEEYRVLRPDGTIGWVLASGRGQYDENGLPLRMTGINLDISSRKQIEQQRAVLLASERFARSAAERASWMKDEFLATLSHELRTPLTAIHGWCQILRRERNPADLELGLEVIERNAYVQTKIIEDLLDMSRIISGKVLLDIKQIDLAKTISASVETVRAAADAKQIHLGVTLPRLTGAMLGDANRLQQVFWNLLSNAIKFTPKGGRVDVVLEECESHLQVSVKDSGEGIRPEFLPFVFDRFRQADASITRRHRGLGIGLAIVKQLIELHGGTVHATSEGDGKGSSFVVTLPTRPLAGWKESHPAAIVDDVDAPSSKTAVKTSLAGLRVLVVDDEPDVRVLVTRLLEEHQAVVTAKGSATEGLDELQRQLPDILISDIGMPEQDGFEFIKRVRALGALSGGIPAIALTAYARNEDRTRALAAGFQMHAAKPIEATELVSLVANLCGRT